MHYYVVDRVLLSPLQLGPKQPLWLLFWGPVRAHISWIKCEIWAFSNPSLYKETLFTHFGFDSIAPRHSGVCFSSSWGKHHSLCENGAGQGWPQAFRKFESGPTRSWDNLEVRRWCYRLPCALCVCYLALELSFQDSSPPHEAAELQWRNRSQQLLKLPRCRTEVTRVLGSA